MTILLISFVVAVIALTLRFGASWFQEYRRAPEEYDWRADKNPALTYGLDRSTFIAAWRQAVFPSGFVYAGAAIIAAFAITPIALGLMSSAWYFFWRMAGQPLQFSEGTIIWQFYLFFGIILVWAACAAIAAWRYHRIVRPDFETRLKAFSARKKDAVPSEA
jgi:hypothetical protein